MGPESKTFAAEVELQTPADTQALGARIAASLAPGDTVALEGDLGAGKTTLARAILNALGLDEAVPSPSFTLVQHYQTPGLAIGHYDLYRVEVAAEIDELGLDEALSDGAVLIEWPERAGDRLPQDALHVQLAITGEESRRARMWGPVRWTDKLPPE
jgi:tRNA threonylcarbamoyl adenosine modification protein YjeE